MIKLSKVIGWYEYEFQINWNDEALIDGNAHYELKAVKIHIDNPNEPIQEVKAELDLIIQNDSVCMIIHIDSDHGIQGATIPITELFEGESKAEQFIENIPVLFFGDPILGCLIRSGLSSLIGTILSCKDKTTEVAELQQRLLAICRCLRAKVNNFSVKITLRALKCMCCDMG